MSTSEVTPDLLRRVAAAWEGGTASDDYARHELRARADHLERTQRPLPTVPGWYPGIVVERAGESCTGALLTDNGIWITPLGVDECRHTHFLNDGHVTVRWAEQDGKTPGQTAMEAFPGEEVAPWAVRNQKSRDFWERLADAVLAAHGTPTLTPVGEHPEPGTRGLLPVVLVGDEWSNPYYDVDSFYVCKRGSEMGGTVLADPRPDGAHE